MATQETAKQPVEAAVGDTSYRAQFDEQLSLIGIVVHEPSTMSAVVKALQKTNKMFCKKGLGSVLDVTRPEVSLVPDTSSCREQQQALASNKHVRVILLDSSVQIPTSSQQPPTFKDLPQDIYKALFPATPATPADDAKSSNATTATPEGDAHQKKLPLYSFAKVTVKLSYHNYNSTEILQRLLPKGVVVPSGFEQVGHIAHLNLLPAHQPFRKTIAQVLLDCNPSVRTVVNKTEAISSEFRELPFELLAGEREYNAHVKQHGVDFIVPYDKVYWNSKLSQEHTRLVSEAMQPGDELLDVMAGVGPFAVPAALAGVRCYANDLNPASAEAMRQNAKLNKVPASMLQVTCLDGREFIRKMRDEHLVKGCLPSPGGSGSSRATAADATRKEKNKPARSRSLRHFVMNLPATAVQFLDAFTGAGWPVAQSSVARLHDDDDNSAVASSSSQKAVTSLFDNLFVVHVYCFSACNDAAAAMRDATVQVANVLRRPVGAVLPDDGATANNANGSSVVVHRVHVVRDVAPNKLMVCVSFSPQLVAPQDQHDAIRKEVGCFFGVGGDGKKNQQQNTKTLPTRRDRE